MMLEQLKNYIKANTDVGEGIQLGGIDGNTEKCIGVYPGKPPAAQRVCLGGAEQTRAGEFYAAVLVHWAGTCGPHRPKPMRYTLCFMPAGPSTWTAAPCAPWSPAAGPCLWGRTTGVCASS